MFTSRRFVGIGVALGFVVGLLAGAGVVLAQGPGASAGAVVPTILSVTAGPTGPSATAGSGSAPTGTAIAYPYPIYAGSPGIAPEHTIVVTGVAQADVASDGSDRAAAQKSALVAALADAKAQATVIAATVGVSITRVVSVSASVGPFGPMAYATGVAPGQAPGQPVPAPVPPQPVWPSQLSVSVTVVYGIN